MSERYEFRITTAERVSCTVSAEIPTRWGSFRALAFVRDTVSASRHAHQKAAVAVCLGDLRGEAPLLRVHPERVTGELLASAQCGCSVGLERALRPVAREGRGVVIYEHQRGLSTGLMENLAHALQAHRHSDLEGGEELDESDPLDLVVPASIVRALGISCVRLLSSQSDPPAGLLAAGIEVWGNARLH